MGCGCSNPDAMTARDFAAVCATCPEAERVGWDPVICTISGQPTRNHCLNGNCPAGYFRSNDDVCTSMGVRWYGPSMLGRLLIWLVHPRHPRPSSFTGCGCIKTLKDLWSKLRAHPRTPELPGRPS